MWWHSDVIKDNVFSIYRLWPWLYPVPVSWMILHGSGMATSSKQGCMLLCSQQRYKKRSLLCLFLMNEEDESQKPPTNPWWRLVTVTSFILPYLFFLMEIAPVKVRPTTSIEAWIQFSQPYGYCIWCTQNWRSVRKAQSRVAVCERGGLHVNAASCKELQFYSINIHNINSFGEIHQENYEALYMNYHIALSSHFSFWWYFTVD